ncbi:fam-c protein [Plasmodium vinckei lentum]|uniref:Fam-c protein n=1 Tax=Plasmodium vinckei lentum TaxID=138297 RepID=A0A6V7S5T3_PLAVN|nr:fam-c protein [Plasmodium vinckei lentum]
MNKRIFSLVCILFYVFMAVSIYCSEQKDDRSKAPGLRSRIVRAIKKISGSNKKNNIESEREPQLNNNNNNPDYKTLLYTNDYYRSIYKCDCFGC